MPIYMQKMQNNGSPGRRQDNDDTWNSNNTALLPSWTQNWTRNWWVVGKIWQNIGSIDFSELIVSYPESILIFTGHDGSCTGMVYALMKYWAIIIVKEALGLFIV